MTQEPSTSPNPAAVWLRSSLSEIGELLSRGLGTAVVNDAEGAAADRPEMPDLADRRRAAGLTLWELSERTRIPLGTIARWELACRVPAHALEALQEAIEQGRPTRAGDGTRRGVPNLEPQAAPGEGRRALTAEELDRARRRIERSVQQGEDPVTPEELRAIIEGTGSSYRKIAGDLGLEPSRIAGWGGGYTPIPPRFWSRFRMYGDDRALPQVVSLSAEDLHDARVALGLSQPELGARAGGLSDQSIRAYEHGQREIPRTVQIDLRTALEKAARIDVELSPQERADRLEELSRPARQRRLDALERRAAAIALQAQPVTRDELKDVLLRSGLRHVDLAERLGVQKAVVDRWARGTHRPAPEFWEPIREIGRSAAAPMGARPIEGQEIRRRRRASGMSRPQLARRLGVPLHRVEGWEDKGIRVRAALWEPIRQELERAESQAEAGMSSGIAGSSARAR